MVERRPLTPPIEELEAQRFNDAITRSMQLGAFSLMLGLGFYTIAKSKLELDLAGFLVAFGSVLMIGAHIANGRRPWAMVVR